MYVFVCSGGEGCGGAVYSRCAYGAGAGAGTGAASPYFSGELAPQPQLWSPPAGRCAPPPSEGRAHPAFPADVSFDAFPGGSPDYGGSSGPGALGDEYSDGGGEAGGSSLPSFSTRFGGVFPCGGRAPPAAYAAQPAASYAHQVSPPPTAGTTPADLSVDLPLFSNDRRKHLSLI